MLFKAGPVIRAFDSLSQDEKKPFCIMMSPKGMKFNQQMANELAKKDDIAIICGHYEGIDERVFENICDLEISIGDFVLTGGELGACVVADAVLRLVNGVLSEEGSSKNETHQSPLLEYPQYTRPSTCEYGNVPEVLLSGHHKNIQTYRRQQSLMATLAKREDLFMEIDLTKEDISYLDAVKQTIEKAINKNQL